MRRSLIRWLLFSVVLLLAATAIAAWAHSSNGAADGAAQERGRTLGLQAAATPSGASDAIMHIVKRGETLAAIAQRYGIDLWAIAHINGITNPDRIYAGQALRIPLPATPIPTTACPCEEIVIISPSRGMTITSPITVSGMASSPFEQTVVAAVLDGSGAQIGVATGSIAGEMGARGPFTVTVPFSVPFNSQPGRVQVFTESPRDGAIEHLGSVTVAIQGLDIDALLEQMETAISLKNPVMRAALMAPQFRFGAGGLKSELANMSAQQAIAMLWLYGQESASPRLDFSVNARDMLGDKFTWPDDVVHVVYSTGWGANQNDDAFLLFGPVDGRARWTGILYVVNDLIDYR